MNQKESLSTKSAKGAKVLLLAQGIKFVANFAGLIILSRLLSPSAFGLTAIAIAIVGIGEILRDFGLSSASIREPHLSKQQQSNLFWINFSIGISLALLLSTTAPLVSNLLNIPELLRILPAVSLIFILNGASTQHRAELNRSMQYKRLALCDSVHHFLAFVLATVLALSGADYWAIVLQYISIALFSTILIFTNSRWLPLKPKRGAGTKRIILFGTNIGISQVISYLGNNIDTLSLGAFSTKTQSPSRLFHVI